ncbi:MAG TPA: radical SAM protein, partial [Anaerolineae bacterium]|nr:radical SAM protein [Anaerolineae bacterium]
MCQRIEEYGIEQRATGNQQRGEGILRVLFIEKQIDYEPQGIMSLSAVLKAAGHDVALTICQQEDPVKFAQAYEPDIIGYSVMTGSQHFYFELNRRLKEELKKPFFAAFGGPHPTFFPEMINEPGVDGLCVGEGEGAIVDLANSMAENDGARPGRPPRFRPDIPNWWFKLDGEIVRNPVRPLIAELDSLPMPDRALIYDKHRFTRVSPIKHFMSSRGCPYNCTYCFNHAYYQIYKRAKRGHQRSVDHVIQEVKMVQERWPLEHVVFLDDLFIIYDDWLEELAEKWPKEVGLPFFCNVRANLLVRGPHKVELLKKAGCSTVSMGIETANDRIRLELLRRRMTREEMIQAGRMVREAGMHITSTNMLGLPTSTLEDDLDTMRLNAEARISYAHAFLFQPYPGTELGQFTQENNLMVGSFDDISSIAWERSVLIFKSEDEKRQIEHLQRLFALGVEWPWLEPVIRWL